MTLDYQILLNPPPTLLATPAPEVGTFASALLEQSPKTFWKK